MTEEALCGHLSNGIQFVCQPIPWSHTIAVGLWIKVGAQNEKPGEEGLAHFLEHMVFKGTRRHTARQIAQRIDSLGGHWDAFTEKELTCFHFRVLPEHLPHSLALLREILTEPAFRPKDIEVEKAVVLAEIQSVEDTPEDLIGDLFFEALWDTHPLSHPVLGTRQSVPRFHQKMLVKFLRRHYLPCRMIFSAAGAFKPDRFLQSLERHFGDLKNGALSEDDPPSPSPHPTFKVVTRQTEHLYFCFGVPSFPVTSPLHYPASLLDVLLGGGASSRLFMEIRERRGLAYSIGTFSAAFQKAGFFAVSGSCGIKEAPKLMAVVARELRRLEREGLRNGELERAKTQLKINIVMAQESITGTMMRLGRQLCYFGRIIPVKEVLNRVDQVTEGEVLTVARRLFSAEGGFAAAFVGPISPKDVEGLMEPLTQCPP